MVAPPSSPTLRRNAPLLCAYHALQMALFPMAIVTLFWNRDLGFTMTQIMLLQAIFGVSMVVLEFPSGYLADRIGYRSALLLGALGSIAGWTAHASATSFWTVAGAEVLLGAGISLVSGADTALLYESLVETEREHEYGRWYGRMRAFGQTAEGSAALAAGLLYAQWPRLPMAVQVAVWIVGASVAWRLVEPARHRAPSADHLARVRAIVRHVARENAPLRAVVFTTTVVAMTTFVPVWLIALYAVGDGVPVAWLGPIWAVANYTVALGSLASDGFGRRLGSAPTLLACVGLAAAGYAGLGLAHALFGFAFYFAITLSRGLAGSVLHHAEQRLIPTADRASFLSLRSLVFRATFLFVGPSVGAGVDRFGQRPVILVAGAVLTALSLVGCLWLARAIRPSPRGG